MHSSRLPTTANARYPLGGWFPGTSGFLRQDIFRGTSVVPNNLSTAVELTHPKGSKVSVTPDGRNSQTSADVAELYIPGPCCMDRRWPSASGIAGRAPP